MAVKVTEAPAQIGFEEAEMDTLTGSDSVTDIVMEFDVAGFPVEHARFDVRIQAIVFPFAGICE